MQGAVPKRIVSRWPGGPVVLPESEGVRFVVGVELQLQQRQRELEQPEQLQQQPGVWSAVASAKMMASLFTFESLHRAWLDCRRRKRGKPAALSFEANAEEELLALSSELAGRTYRPRPSFCFVARNDKYREVFAAQFRDRVVHHLLVRELEKTWEPVFIHDSYACRGGKGTHAAVKRLRTFMRRATANGTRRAWFAQLDIRSFFPSVDRSLLLEFVQSRLRSEELRWLAEVIISHDPSTDPVFTCSREKWRRIPPGKSLFSVPHGKGLPIGNLTSQFFANVYLNPLDQFVKHSLKVKYYIRYVDDMKSKSIGKSRFQGPFQRPGKGRSRHPLRFMSGEATDGRVHFKSSGRVLPGS